MSFRLSDERLVELTRQRVAEIGDASLVRRYALGPLEAALLDRVRSTSPNGIEHALVAIDPITEGVEVAFWVEQNRLASFTGAATHRLVSFHQGRRAILDESSGWSERARFELEALARAEKLTGHGHDGDAPAPRRDAIEAKVPRTMASDATRPSDSPLSDSSDSTVRSSAARGPAMSEAAPPSAAPPSSIRRAVARAYRSRELRPVAVIGTGGAILLLLKIVLKVVACSASNGTPSVPERPPTLPTPEPVRPWGDALHGRDPTLDRIAADEQEIFWVSRRDEILFAESIADGRQRTVSEGLHNPTGIALDEHYAYVTCASGRGRDRRGAVLQVPKRGSPPMPLTYALVHVGAPVVHEGFLYFLEGMVLEDFGEHEKDEAFTELVRFPLFGGTRDTYLWNTELVPALAVSDTRVLWLPWGEPALRFGPIGPRHLHDPPPFEIRLPAVTRSPSGDPAASDASVATARPTALAVFEDTAYVAVDSHGGGSIVYRVDPDPPAVNAVLASQDRIREINVERYALWWVEESGELFDVRLCAAPNPDAPPAAGLAGGRQPIGPYPAASSPSAIATDASADGSAPSTDASDEASEADSKGRGSRCASAEGGSGLESFVVARGLPRGTHIALTRSRVYWTTGNGVRWVTKDAVAP